MGYVVVMSEVFSKNQEVLNSLKHEINLAQEQAEARYTSVLEQEIKRIGKLKESEVTVAEKEWYRSAQAGAFHLVNQRNGF